MRTAAQRLLGIRGGESGLLLRCGGLAMAAIATQVLSLGTSTALLLGSYSAAYLPGAYAASAVLGVILSWAMTRAAGRVPRTTEAAGAFLLVGASLVAARLALPFAPWLVLALQPWAQVTSSIVVVQAYTLSGEHMDGVQARRLLPLVGAGGTLGAVAAGLMMARLAPRIGAPNLLVIAGVACAAGAAIVAAMAKRDRPVTSPVRAPARASAPEPRWNRLLALLALSAALSTIAVTVVRFAFEAALRESFPRDRMAAYFGGFMVAVNLAVLLIQMTAEARLVRRFGLTFALLVAPVVLGGGIVTLALAGVGLWVATGTRLAESVARFSLGRTGEELIVGPVPSLERRRARVVITGIIIPVATLAAAGLLALARVTWAPLRWLGGAAAAAGAIAAVLAMRGPYVDALKRALRERRLKMGRHTTVIAVSSDAVLDDLRRELGALASARLLEARVGAGPGDVEVLAADVRVHRRAAEERIFRLCHLVASPPEMTRAWLAYASGDRNARGFALEVLRHELPRPVARTLLPHLEDPTLEEVVSRARGELGLTLDLTAPWPVLAAASDEPWQRWLALHYAGAEPRDEGERHMRELAEELYVLRKVPLFAQLSAQELRPIAEASEEIELPAGTVLFQQGEPGNAFYIVLEGKLRVERDGRTIAAIGDHECFGEMALLDRGLRTATVITETPCELSVISSEDFDDLLSEHPSIARSMLAILARRLAGTEVGE